MQNSPVRNYEREDRKWKGLKKSNMEQKNKKNNLFNRTLIFKSVEMNKKKKKETRSHDRDQGNNIAITLQRQAQLRNNHFIAGMKFAEILMKFAFKLIISFQF